MPPLNPSKPPRISISEFNLLAETDLPFLSTLDADLVELSQGRAVMRARCGDSTLRPGGTVSGPVMMGLADAVFYAIVLANIGMTPLAVTTNLNINFLRKPGPGDLYCRAALLKLGKRLVVCEGLLYTGEHDEDKPVAHATGTYSIPPA
jgi:uncharacterized protein (TIGR00369 family)